MIRADVPGNMKWYLETLYSGGSEIDAELERVERLISEIAPTEGGVESSTKLMAYLHIRDELRTSAQQLGWYGKNMSAADLLDITRQRTFQKISDLSSRIRSAIAEFEATLRSISDEVLGRWIAEEPDLEPYHVRTLGDESTKRAAGSTAALAELQDLPLRIWFTLTAADMTFDPVTNARDRTTDERPTVSSLSDLMRLPDRQVRESACKSLHKGFDQHRHTITAILVAAVRRDIALARSHHYNSSYEAAVATAGVDVEFMNGLIRTCEEGGGLLRRYMEIRRRILGVETVMAYDTSAPLGPEPLRRFTVEDARTLAVSVLGTLGYRYENVVTQAFDEHWIDWAPNVGKKSGAYCSPCVGRHPVILLNWYGTYSDLFALFHELGHCAHLELAQQARPNEQVRLPTHLSEFPSTVNELLLGKALLLEATGDLDARRRVLTYLLDAVNTNLYLAVIVTQFQRLMHESVESGDTLTYESITKLMSFVLARWFGDTVDTSSTGLGPTWMQVPHNFRGFFSFQHAVGIAGAANVVRSVETGDHNGYIRFLQAGASSRLSDLFDLEAFGCCGSSFARTILEAYGAWVEELEQTFY